jgi:hypothetical protein
MKTPLLIFSLLLLSFLTGSAQPAPEKKEVLRVVQQFFDALEKQDTLAWHNVFLKDARNFYLSESNDTVRSGLQDPFTYKFRADRIIRERMRNTGVNVQIHGRIAAVWAPYDLWVNDAYSHCGVDVFTLLKTPAGWKISSCSYTMEKEGCGNNQKSR